MPKSHGIRRKSRHIMTKGNMSRGLSHLLINYSIGDKVVVIIDPREHKRTVKIGILVGDKQKYLQTKFNHIRPIK
jgi:large subunit ribosomal protein L21e